MDEGNYITLRRVCPCGNLAKPTKPGRGRPATKCYDCGPLQTQTAPEKKRKKPDGAIRCGVCAVEFCPIGNYGQKYCTDKCRNQASSIAHWSRSKADKSPRKCRQCETVFAPTFCNWRSVFCSAPCKAKNHSERTSGSTHTRRAKKFGCEVERVDRLVVFERDGWLCRLCGVSVTKANAELDHVIPLSKGGGHTYANTQCLCSNCNRGKGAKYIPHKADGVEQRSKHHG